MPDDVVGSQKIRAYATRQKATGGINFPPPPSSLSTFYAKLWIKWDREFNAFETTFFWHRSPFGEGRVMESMLARSDLKRDKFMYLILLIKLHFKFHAPEILALCISLRPDSDSILLIAELDCVTRLM